MESYHNRANRFEYYSEQVNILTNIQQSRNWKHFVENCYFDTLQTGIAIVFFLYMW